MDRSRKRIREIFGSVSDWRLGQVIIRICFLVALISHLCRLKMRVNDAMRIWAGCSGMDGNFKIHSSPLRADSLSTAFKGQQIFEIKMPKKIPQILLVLSQTCPSSRESVSHILLNTMVLPCELR